MAVSTYYPKLHGLWDEMQSFLPTPKCKCNKCTRDIGKSLKELREKEQLYEFLMGLDNEFWVIKNREATHHDQLTWQRSEKPTGYCDFCNKNGHTRDGCFRRIGYPEWWPGKKSDKEKPMAACAEVDSRPLASLTKEQYEAFLKDFALENKETRSDAPRSANMAGTDESKITRKPSKTSKHKHENGRVNKSQKQS
ncbi:hypothetical protein Tco_1160422 [Tanacetum coccineum]